MWTVDDQGEATHATLQEAHRIGLIESLPKNQKVLFFTIYFCIYLHEFFMSTERILGSSLIYV